MKTTLFGWSLSLCLFSVLSSGPGCSKRTASAAGDLSHEQIVFSQGLGPLKFGATEQSTVQLLGPPDARQGRVLNYTRFGFAVFLGRDNMRVSMIGAGSDRSVADAQRFKGKTAEGIGIGSTKQEVLAAYGEPDSAHTRQIDQNAGAREELLYKDKHVKCILQGGKVIVIYWGTGNNRMLR